MVIISKATLHGFSELHPEVQVALLKWYEETVAADWRNFT